MYIRIFQIATIAALLSSSLSASLSDLPRLHLRRDDNNQPAPPILPSAVINAASAPTTNPSRGTTLSSSYVITTTPTTATSVKTAKLSPTSTLPQSHCLPLSSGPGPRPTPDTPSAFRASKELYDVAGAAPVPSGFVKTFGGLNASVSGEGYLGIVELGAYDPGQCAQTCIGWGGSGGDGKVCKGFNIYFERDPLLDPSEPDCANPNSTTVIKCTLWSDVFTSINATNIGQMREKFDVAVAGSNGYAKGSEISVKPPVEGGSNGLRIGGFLSMVMGVSVMIFRSL